MKDIYQIPVNTGTPHTPPQRFIDWLEQEKGRGAYFERIDPSLTQPVITKMKRGILPITLEYAVRIERAQKPSAAPLKAEEIMTFPEHRELYRYVTGQAPAPEPIEVTRRPRGFRARASVEA